ncbi:MAG: alanyl-tRNA editing protein [Treponema sp.]|jgi:alanyl-tRNA synthetase|nr:alanyl-tRNA editing protein [Treponema sp.]
MKTVPAYYEFAGTDSFPVNILELRSEGDKTALILDKTIFYPGGGGQPADRGSVNGVPLLDVLEKDGEILHIIESGDGGRLAPGPAELVLDLKRRRDFTVQHTAQHLLSGTILRLTGKHTVSMHLGEETNTIDVDAPQIDPESLARAEDTVMDIIETDVPVIIHLCPPENIADFPLRKTPPQGEEVVRVVEIQGSDFSPCCGTHLETTGRIGMLRILGAEKYKGMTRVSFIAGRRVLQDSRVTRQNGETVSRALKVPVAETGKAVLALIEKANQFEKQVKELEETAAHGKAKNLLHKAKILKSRGRDAENKEQNSAAPEKLRVFSINYPASEMEDLLRIGRAAQKLTPTVLVFFSPFLFKFAAFCSAENADIRPLLKDRMEARGGRGGGSASFFQGLFDSAEDIETFVASLPEEADSL